MKYKVGDKVKVRSDLKGLGPYYMEGRATGDTLVSAMRKYCGEVVTIQDITSSGKYRIREDGGEYNWTDGMLEGPAASSKIIITTDGKTTTAKLFNGKELVKSAEAKCSPSDEFDFEKGAALAVNRLLGREEEKKAPEFSKADLKDGMFCRMRDGSWFVIVGDLAVFDDGCYCYMHELDDNLSWSVAGPIDVVLDGVRCFNVAKLQGPDSPFIKYLRHGVKL